MAVQSFLSEHLHDPRYCDWLPVQALNGTLPFDLTRLDKYEEVFWQAKRWGWVDPLKDIEASRLAIKTGIASPQMIAAQAGVDVEDVIQAIAEFEKLVAAANVSLVNFADTAAQQAADSGGVLASYGVRVFQRNAVMGRGYVLQGVI